MQYRKFGKLDWKVSALGFGAMRLPTIGEDRGNIDEAEAIKMVRYAFDHGVNYIDTAYPYHSGKSEMLVGKILKDGYGEKVKLATKMPTWLVNSQKDMDKFLDEQLGKLQTDHIDFYLLHGLRKERWDKMQELKVIEWAENAIADGRIRYLGFSFHDEYKVFKEIIDSYDGWTFCQIQYNYMDVESGPWGPGISGLKYAASKGLAVVIMEPIAGGMLAVKPPQEVQAIWDQAEIKRTPAEWALQWVWNHPEVSVVLSGMSTMEQVIENVESADRSGPGTLTAEELELISRVKEKYLEYGFIGCTDCGYCMPCPEGVNIPKIFEFYNEYSKRRGDREAQQEVVKRYGEVIPPENGAKVCAKCGQCEEKCSQQLPIRNLLARAARIFERNR
ncbi:MAG: aldo/keto reductase [Candidatus Bathyarchaeia archaeon]